jgi:hypothetical protein
MLFWMIWHRGEICTFYYFSYKSLFFGNRSFRHEIVSQKFCFPDVFWIPHKLEYMLQIFEYQKVSCDGSKENYHLT